MTPLPAAEAAANARVICVFFKLDSCYVAGWLFSELGVRPKRIDHGR
jgi:hypothetical protein